MDYTLADIVRISGAKRRSIQLWAEAGVIHAHSSTERRGTGTHRRFSKDEAIIASIINVFSKRQVAIGELQRLASALRRFLRIGNNRRRIVYESEERYLFFTWRTDRMPAVDVCDLDEMADVIGWEDPLVEASIVISLYRCLNRLQED